MTKYTPWLASAAFLLGVALIALIVGGCDKDGIPIDVDPCLIEGVEECAPECDVDAAFNEGYNVGVESVECAPDVTIIVIHPEPNEDTCDLSVPVGHRPIECRGKN